MRNPARSRFLASLVMAAFFLAPLGGCTRARVDAAGVQAEPYAPEAAEVPLVRVPYDPRFPRFVVAVEPFALQADSAVAGPPVQSIVYGPGSWGVLPHGPRPIGWTPPRQQLSAHVGESVQTQLVSALSNVGNLIVIDYDYYWQNRDRIDRLVGKGEAGPYLLRGAVTEFNEISESDESGTGSSLGLIGVALGIAGAIAGNSPAAYTGLGLAVANPGYQESVARRNGAGRGRSEHRRRAKWTHSWDCGSQREFHLGERYKWFLSVWFRQREHRGGRKRARPGDPRSDEFGDGADRRSIEGAYWLMRRLVPILAVLMALVFLVSPLVLHFGQKAHNELEIDWIGAVPEGSLPGVAFGTGTATIMDTELRGMTGWRPNDLVIWGPTLMADNNASRQMGILQALRETVRVFKDHLTKISSDEYDENLVQADNLLRNDPEKWAFPVGRGSLPHGRRAPRGLRRRAAEGPGNLASNQREERRTDAPDPGVG